MSATAVMRNGMSSNSREGLTIATTAQTVEATAVRVGVLNAKRKGGVIINKSDVPVYYGYLNTVDAAASSSDTVGVIPPFGSLPLYDGFVLYTGDVYCICETGDTAYMTFEEYT